MRRGYTGGKPASEMGPPPRTGSGSATQTQRTPPPITLHLHSMLAELLGVAMVDTTEDQLIAFARARLGRLREVEARIDEYQDDDMLTTEQARYLKTGESP